jgi:hypothetical protein
MTQSKITHTLDETGKCLAETKDGITMPADYSFATINNYVHGIDVHFEDLVNLCLGMANHIDNMQPQLIDFTFDCRTCSKYNSVRDRCESIVQCVDGRAYDHKHMLNLFKDG